MKSAQMGSADAALRLELAPLTLFTAQATAAEGRNGGGIVLVEVYAP